MRSRLTKGLNRGLWAEFVRGGCWEPWWRILVWSVDEGEMDVFIGTENL